jgi:Ca-activated chloride channel homolog
MVAEGAMSVPFAASLFAYPQNLWLLLVLPVLSLLNIWAQWRRGKAWKRLGNLLALERMTPRQRRWRRLRNVCWSVGLTLLVVGSAGPQWGREWGTATMEGRDVLVVLDLSHSMLAEQPSRQHLARRALLDLVKGIQERGGHRLGLIVFASRPKLVCPLTHDYDHFREALAEQDAAQPAPELRPVVPEGTPETGPISGTRIGLALQRAVQTHDARFRGFQDILLVSDGDDPVDDFEWRAGVVEAREQRIPVHTVGVGDPKKKHPIYLVDRKMMFQGKTVETSLKEMVLEDIAHQTEGVYIAARTSMVPLAQLFREHIESRGTRQLDIDGLPMMRQRYAWFLGTAFFFITLALWLPERPSRNHPWTYSRVFG